MATKKFIYGIAVVKFNGKEIGYIEKGSWDWGGTKAESTDIEAEQVPDAPVLTLANKNATIAPTFNLIQLDYENIAGRAGRHAGRNSAGNRIPAGKLPPTWWNFAARGKSSSSQVRP